MRSSRHPLRPVATVILLGLVALPVAAGFVTFGNGFGSKWDDPNHGTPAVVTWGFMLPGTTVDPGVPISAEIVGGSDVAQLRSNYDTTYGAGAFDAAIERALATWASVSGVSFVGPVADSGLPVGSVGATDPDIRIGAFDPVPLSPFDGLGAVGFGPPGDDLNFPDPLAGDVLFNLAATFIEPAGDEDDPILEFGNDLENLTLHELGHAAMGLGHPGDGPGEVMYVGAGCCDLINRFPSVDDITGAQIVYGPPECDNGIDDDGDTLIDAADPGCDQAFDDKETSDTLACDNGIDDDGDGWTDWGGGDPGCRNATHALEDPECQDGIDNDNRIGTDFDGGESILGVGNGDPDGADPDCTSAWIKSEKPPACGLGVELAVLLPGLRRWLRRRRAQAGGAAAANRARYQAGGKKVKA